MVMGFIYLFYKKEMMYKNIIKESGFKEKCMERVFIDMEVWLLKFFEFLKKKKKQVAQFMKVIG
jgi:hypothetical protein